MKAIVLAGLCVIVLGASAPAPAQERKFGAVDQQRSIDAEADARRTSDRRSHRRGGYPQGVTKVGEPNPYEPKVGAPNPYATQGGTPNPYATQGGAPAYSGRGAPRR
jgi:hypothetical protein